MPARKPKARKPATVNVNGSDVPLAEAQRLADRGHSAASAALAAATAPPADNDDA